MVSKEHGTFNAFKTMVVAFLRRWRRNSDVDERLLDVSAGRDPTMSTNVCPTSTNIDFAPHIKSSLRSMTTAASKAFRANVGQLREHQALNLQQFVQRTCAVSTIFRSDRGFAVLVALRDVSRTSASHARTVRMWLKKIAIPTIGLRGHWCTLLTESEVLTLCAGPCRELPPMRPHDEPAALPTPHPETEDVKTIRLY